MHASPSRAHAARGRTCAGWSALMVRRWFSDGAAMRGDRATMVL
ncbi:hypothetical protein [Pseudoduganella albidiflava]|nr:hypothetical protein [Pseudoduganella albidiflava]